MMIKKGNIKKDQILKKDDIIMLFKGGHGFKGYSRCGNN